MTFQAIADLFGMEKKRVEELTNVVYEHFAEGYKK